MKRRGQALRAQPAAGRRPGPLLLAGAALCLACYRLAGPSFTSSSVRRPAEGAAKLARTGAARSLVIARASGDGDAPKKSPFPVLRRLMGGTWAGSMQFAVGPNMQQMPFVLNGISKVSIDGDKCTFCNTVTFPSGQEREVIMVGTANSKDKNVMRMEPESGEGPYSMIVSEQPSIDGKVPDSILVREVNRTTGAVAVAQGLTLVSDEEFVKVSHELSPVGTPEGVQMWHFKRQ
mmetsp:Transcript_11090/g.25211  ORF Transcript_11090/g.25211 Transcript_11090/m.25211 type:complete len:234 (-) Transcript_11090:53-754(-)